eukprot:Opistho-2@77918
MSDYLAQNNRMSAPRGCPPSVSESMESCWRARAETRPTFSQLVLQLRRAMLVFSTARIESEYAVDGTNPGEGDDTLRLSASIGERRFTKDDSGRAYSVGAPDKAAKRQTYAPNLSAELGTKFYASPQPPPAALEAVNGSYVVYDPDAADSDDNTDEPDPAGGREASKFAANLSGLTSVAGGADTAPADSGSAYVCVELDDSRGVDAN